MKKKRWMAAILCVMLVIAMLPASVMAADNLPFSDVKSSSWFYDSVQYVYDHDMMNGTDLDKFSPYTTTTRGMIVTILYNLEGKPSTQGRTFSDVHSGKWYKAGVDWASSANVVSGYSNGKFGPSDPITREQFMAILYRYSAYKGYSTSEASSLDEFADEDKIGTYALRSLEWARAVRLIEGITSTKLQPKGTATRAQAAAILTRYCQNYLSNQDFTVTFDSNGGSSVPSQTVASGETLTKPTDPAYQGYTFLGWMDASGNPWEFDESVSASMTLTAAWAKTAELTEIEKVSKQAAASEEDKTTSGTAAEAMSGSSAIPKVSVDYTLNDEGVVGISQVNYGPLTRIAGLVGSPVSIRSAGGKVNSATITFSYDPKQLGSTSPSQLGIAWYDEKNNITTLLDGSTVDTTNHTVSVKTTHFSNYAVVDKSLWDKAWGTQLPAVRTTASPYYNVVVAIDQSGSMSGDKMTKCTAAAQNFMDVLANDDYVTVLSFDNDVSVVSEQTAVVTQDENGQAQDHRQEIKDAIGKLSAYGGTDIQEALEKSSTLTVNDIKYQSYVILISDGQSSVNDSVLQTLSSQNQKVIAVGIGSDVDTSLMQRIADKTGGSYLYCENADDLKEAFLKLQNIYIGSTTDTDGDGLPDLVEETGMRDQHGEIWKTDPKKADSDGDGISDGEEMGTYISSAAPYFQRNSRPDLYTVHSKEAYIAAPENMEYSVDDQDKHTITLSIYTTNIGYRMVPDLLTEAESDGIPKEYIYSDPVNLKVELTEYPSTYKLESLKTEKVDNEYSVSSTIYKTTAVLSYSSTTTLDTAVWKITADNCSEWSGYFADQVKTNYVTKKQSMKPTFTHKTLKKQDRTVDLAAQSKKIVEAIQKNANTKKEETTSEALADVKKFISSSAIGGDPLPDSGYQALALATVDAIKGSEFDQYETDPIKMTNQIYKLTKNGSAKFDNTRMTVDGITYTLNGSVTAVKGIGVEFMTIRWKGYTSYLMWSNAQTKEGMQALASYCTALEQLNEGVWNEFLAYYAEGAFKTMGFTKVTKDNAQKVIEYTEKTIKALCDKDEANAFLKELGETSEDKLKGVFKNKFKEYVKKNIPKGDKIVSAADAYKTAKEKYDKYTAKLEEYKNAAEEYKNADAVDQSLQEFNTAYDQLKKLTDALE